MIINAEQDEYLIIILQGILFGDTGYEPQPWKCREEFKKQELPYPRSNIFA